MSFPRSQSQNGDGDDGSGEIKWKERASKLEKECETLKQALETMEIRMTSFFAAVLLCVLLDLFSFVESFLANNQAKDARKATPQTTETPSTAPVNQKKGKQKQVSAPTPEETIRPSQVSFDLKSVLRNLAKGKSVASSRVIFL